MPSFFQLNELPDKWMKVKKNAAAVKQTIAPIQSYQVDLIEKRIILCDTMANQYRKRFLRKRVRAPSALNKQTLSH